MRESLLSLYIFIFHVAMSKRWFTLVELILVIVLIAWGLMVVVEGISRSIGFLDKTRNEVIAINLAREGMEAVYQIRNTNRLRRSWARDENRLRTDPTNDTSPWMREKDYITYQQSWSWILVTPDIIDDWLLAYYSFDSSTNIGEDNSGNGHNATNINGIYSPTGIQGWAIDLNGTNAHIAIPGDIGLDGQNTVSVSAWVNFDEYRIHSTILSKDQDDTNDFKFGPWEIVVWWNGMQQYYPNFLPQTSLNTWHHFAFVFDGTQLQSYVDGVLVDTRSFSVTGFDIQNLRIGQDRNIPEWSVRYMDAQIDEVRIYDRVLSATEIQQLYNIQPFWSVLCLRDGHYSVDPSCPPNQESRFSRAIIGKGLYRKDTGDKIMCLGDGSDPSECIDDTPKEYRFCSVVTADASIDSQVELCGAITNFEE